MKTRARSNKPRSSASAAVQATTRGERQRPAIQLTVSRKVELIYVSSLAMVMLVQMIWMAHTKSATMDEPNHITRGLTYLKTGDLRLARIHPPLINVLCALPLIADRRVVLPLDDPNWEGRNLDQFAFNFLWRSNNDGPSIVFRARLPIILITILFAGLVYLWARELYGPMAALLAVTLFAFDPNILANGSIATNDVGVAFFSTLSLYTFWRWLARPSWVRGIIAGLAFGLAQASKFSALFLVAALPLIALAHFAMLPRSERPRINLTKVLVSVGLFLIIGGAIVAAFYGFRMRPSGHAGGVRMTSYLGELRLLRNRISGGNPTFLLGSYSSSGWWYYFPFAFLVKTPVPTLGLIVAGFVYSWRNRTLRRALVLLIPAAIYLGGSIVSPLAIGYRHLLPAVVLLMIFASQVAGSLFHWPSKVAWAGAALMIWLAATSFFSFPDDMAYFNELVGGSSNGYKVLVDSNLDWGQDLVGLRKYMERERIESVKLSYFGSADPAAYGVRFEPLPGYPQYIWKSPTFPPFLLHPSAGIYAISATNLQGSLFQNHNLYAWFRERKPDAVIGKTILIYKLAN